MSNPLISATGINRNIVECKVEECEAPVSSADVLIETLWNVKVVKYNTVQQRRRVLIETLWNVKTGSALFPRHSEAVLIETLWNVKELKNIVFLLQIMY